MPGAGAGADAASILGEGDVADGVEPVLDAPMVPGEAQQALRRGRLGRQAGDEVDDLGAGLAGDLAPALDAGHLGEARPGQIGDDLAADRDLAGLDAAVALLHRLGPGRHRAEAPHRGEASPKAMAMSRCSSGWFVFTTNR